MSKRVSQTTAVNGPICIGVNLRGTTSTITRCVDCADHPACGICQTWAWPHGPLPMDCPLPRAEEEE